MNLIRELTATLSFPSKSARPVQGFIPGGAKKTPVLHALGGCVICELPRHALVKICVWRFGTRLFLCACKSGGV